MDAPSSQYQKAGSCLHALPATTPEHTWRVHITSELVTIGLIIDAIARYPVQAEGLTSFRPT